MTECIPEDIRRILYSFVEEFKKKIGNVEVYLFGSYAKCTWFEDSDIDIVVVSDVFKELDFGERYVLVRKMLPYNRGFEILTYTHEEFEIARRRSIVVQDASEYWIKIS